MAEVEAKADNHSNPDAAERLRRIVKGMKGEDGGYTAEECRQVAADHSVTSTWEPWCDEIERRENWTGTTPTPTPVEPTVSISGGAGVTEGGNAVFTLTANPAPASDLTVNVDVSQQGDYGVSTGSLTVTIGTSGTATLSVATTGDDLDEPDGSVTVALATGSGYDISTSNGAATVSVSDDDDPLPAEFVPNAQLVAEVEAKADNHSNPDAAERLRRIVKGMKGEDGGYTAAQCRETAAHHGVTDAWQPWCDEIERRENWTGTTPTPTPVEPTVSISGGAGVTEGADATFTLTANPAPSADLTVNVTVSQQGDYGVSTGSQTVTIGTTGTATLTVATTGDNVDEPDGSVTAKLATGNGYTVSSSNGAATVTVADDDDPPLTTLPQVSIADATAREDHILIEFTLTLSEASAIPVKVQYGLQEGTATEATDYSRAGSEVTIPAGRTRATLYVNLIDNPWAEGAETFEVILTGVTGATIDDGTAVGTIIDDD